MAVASPTGRKPVTKRSVSTAKADAAKTPQERLRALADSFDPIHFSHNEARRLAKEWIMAATEILAPKAKAKKTAE